MNPARLACAIAVLLFTCPAPAQSSDVYWHVDANVRTCSMVLDPSLTQAQWRTFTEQVGAILSFKSLAAAAPLGRGHFTLGIDDGITPVDQRDPAWVNTFAHPDAHCPLGDQVAIPTLARARAGLSSRMDAAAFWSMAPRANDGTVGAELRYAVLEESGRMPAATVSASVSALTGVPDFDLAVYSTGVSAGKHLAFVTPYVGVRSNLMVATERTAKVDLNPERFTRTQGFLGATTSLWKVELAAEYDVAVVNTFAVAMGYRR